MASLWLALIQSGQDTNDLTSPAPGGPTDEMAQMRVLADHYQYLLDTEFKGYPITYKRIPIAPQSRDTYRYQSLHEAQADAKAWLAGKPADAIGLSYNLHSDAGATSSWVAYCYDTQSQHSKALGAKVASAIAPVFGTSSIRAIDYTTYIMAEDQQHANNPLLIEHGNHQCAADNLTLHTKGQEVARAALGAIVAYFGLTKPDPPTDPAYALVQGAELRAWLIAHPDVGKPRFKSVRDSQGEYVWTASTAAHKGGSLVVRRDWVPSWTTEHVRVMDW